MAGSQTLRLRGGRFAAALAVSLPDVRGSRPAQYPSPPLPPAAMPARSFADLVETGAPPVAMPVPTTAPGPSYYPGSGVAPSAPRVEMGLFDTITESLFGDAIRPSATGGRSRSAPSSARAGSSPGPVAPPGNPA